MNIHMALLLAVMATAFIFEWLGAKHTQKRRRKGESVFRQGRLRS